MSYVLNFSSAEVWRIGGNDSWYQFVIDNVVMSDTDDEHMYREMLVPPVLTAFSLPQDVLTIDGVEGATLRATLQNVRVDKDTMVDIGDVYE